MIRLRLAKIVINAVLTAVLPIKKGSRGLAQMAWISRPPKQKLVGPTFQTWLSKKFRQNDLRTQENDPNDV